MSPVSHLVLNELFPKVNQIINNIQRTTTSNLNAIKPTVQKISRPLAFLKSIFSKYPLSAILFLTNFSPKLFRSSGICAQRTTTSNLNAIKIIVHIRYNTNKLFWRPFVLSNKPIYPFSRYQNLTSVDIRF